MPIWSRCFRVGKSGERNADFTHSCIAICKANHFDNVESVALISKRNEDIAISCNKKRLIGNRIQAFDWQQFRWPLTTVSHHLPLHSFCLSNVMQGQNINLPVCVSVCVPVTLSVSSPTGQTPQRIFTVDSLKDADLRKDMPFGGFRWWIITFRILGA